MTNQTTRAWKIRDIDGSNERAVTLAQFRAEVEAAKAKAAAIYNAAKPSVHKS